MSAATPVHIGPGRAPAGSIQPPGDKSITHRALVFALLAEGETRIEDPNPGEDCQRSAEAVGLLGGRVRRMERGWTVVGAVPGQSGGEVRIDCGNSGTTMRLLAGLTSGLRQGTRLSGDASLSRRPMDRIAEPLRRMGARIEGQGPNCTAPLRIEGGALSPLDHVATQASAQVSTAILLAGLHARGRTSVRLPGPARDHTERMLPAFGVMLQVEPLASGGRQVAIEGGQRPTACSLRVPGDPSAAAFILAWAAATPGGRVTARRMSLNPTRTGFLEVLHAMGAGVEVRASGEEAGESVGDVTVTGPDRLRAFAVPPEWMPRMIDEVPAWATLAAVADGTSSVRGAQELRVKESDRIATLADALAVCGIAVRPSADGLEVTGGTIRGGRVRTHLDHRIAMAGAVLGALSNEGVRLDDARCIATSYPHFLEDLIELGAGVREVRA